jgi:hypothetical protein
LRESSVGHAIKVAIECVDIAGRLFHLPNAEYVESSR